MIGALTLLVLWRVPAERAQGPPIQAKDAPVERVEERDPLTPSRPADEVAENAATTDLEQHPTAGAAQRSQPPDPRPRISGVVRAPSDVLAAEAVKVRAEVFPEKGKGGAQKLSAPVASDGSFTLLVPEDTQYAKLDLESRFLALSGPVKARAGQTGVVLYPLVYAAIEGEVVPPQSLLTLGVSWADMEVSWSFDPGHMSAQDMLNATLSPSRDKTVEPDHDGVFALSFVPVGAELDLHAENPFGPEWIQRIEPLAPAERRKITIALEPGITISGRVIDEHGLAVAGAEISTDEDHRAHAWCSRPGNAPSDAEGRFVLERMPRRVTKISVDEFDLALGAEATVDGTSGDVRGVVLSVVRGGCIEGTVFWSDHSPAELFDVSAIGVVGVFTEGQAGSFRLCGLDAGSYRVDIRAKGEGVVGTATALDVQVGAAPLELVLAEERAFEAHGVVVDREGTPVRRFSLSATGPAPEYRHESADGYDGRLLLIGLAPGEWSFEVSASDYQDTRQQVVVGEGMAPLRFELMSAGRISGRVVDSADVPVADAWVGEEEDVAMLAFPAPRSDSTDADGRFVLQPTSTRARILASKRGFSPSEVQEYEVGPGETLEGIVLRLRETCRVEGRVLDEHGDPLTGVKVSSSAISSMGTSVDVDAHGVFELDGLPPGVALLFAYHPQRDGMASATVTLTSGQPASVDLRFEKPDPVFVHGRVTRGGKPVECNFGLLCRGFATECASGSDGRFEVSLQRPGEWKGAVWLASESFSLPDLTRIDVRRFEISVPDADQHAFELEFDALPRLISMEELLR
jgi:hypothetical protein